MSSLYVTDHKFTTTTTRRNPSLIFSWWVLPLLSLYITSGGWRRCCLGQRLIWPADGSDMQLGGGGVGGLGMSTSSPLVHWIDGGLASPLSRYLLHCASRWYHHGILRLYIEQGGCPPLLAPTHLREPSHHLIANKNILFNLLILSGASNSQKIITKYDNLNASIKSKANMRQEIHLCQKS